MVDEIRGGRMQTKNEDAQKPATASMPEGDVLTDADDLDTSKAAPAASTSEILEAAGEQQRIHDDKVVGAMFPGEGEPGDEDTEIPGVNLDRLSLTTLKFLRRADSGLLEGKMPEDVESVLREIGLYIMAHNSDVPIRERAKLFRKCGTDDFEDELDATLHEVPVSNCEGLLQKIATKLAEETSTLVVPVADKGEDAEVGALEEGNA